MADITRKEALEKIQELYSNSFNPALEFAISDMERVKKLEAENKRLKRGIANVKAEIEKYTVVDICKVSHVLHIINKYLGK